MAEITFNLTEFETPVPVTLERASVEAGLTEEKLMNYRAFRDWRATMKDSLDRQKSNKNHAFHEHPYRLVSIAVQGADFFPTRPPKLGFIKFNALIKNDEEKKVALPGITFMRGGSVAVLVILQPRGARDERWVVMTEQPRVPSGSLAFLEIPAGMIENSATFTGAAAKEIEEETGLTIPVDELIDMTELALRGSESPEKMLQPAMYPSPGGCDEFIPLLLWEKVMDRQEIEVLKDKLSGLMKQGEMITVRLRRYEDLWKEGARDAKTLAAWALYEGLNRAGTLEKERLKRAGDPGLDKDEVKKPRN